MNIEKIITTTDSISGESTEHKFFIDKNSYFDKNLEISQYIDESNIGTSFDQFKPLDGLWSINQTNDETEAGYGRVFVVKHRNGKSRYSFTVKYAVRNISFEMFNCFLVSKRVNSYFSQKVD